MKRTIIILLLTIFTLSCATSSVADFAGFGKGTDKVPLTTSAISGTLPNGLRYYILENSYPENRAHLALVVNAGSVLETDDQRGLAHFVEHLAFNDTARFPKLELIEYLRSLGMRFGADANAYTSLDETVYYFDIPIENSGGIKRIPDRALAILDDWTYAVSFKPEDVASESMVVLEELRTRLGAMDRARKIILPILFKGSPYAVREPIGLANIIENAMSGQLKAFYDRWYTSDNMALVFVGDFDGKALEAELSSHFNMPAASQSVNRPYYELPPPKNGNFHVEVITDPELSSSRFLIDYKQKQKTQRGTIAYYRESLINYLIGIILSMRFEEAASNPQSSANESWGGIWRGTRNTRFYSMETQPKTGKIPEALRELLLEKESMRRFGFTETEIDRAKLILLSNMEKQLSEKDRRESRVYVEKFTDHFIFGETLADIEWELDFVNYLFPRIGLREIAQAARNYFSYNDINVFLLVPQAEAENAPSPDRIRAIFKETENARITPRREEAVSGELMDRVPIPGTVASENDDAQTGAHIITFANGARVILKETANKNNEIIMYAMARGGTANATENTIVSVNLLSEMINVSGLGPYSRTELVNKLAGKQVSMSFWTSDYYRGVQGSSTTADLKTLFEMIHLFFTKPRLDERAVAAMLDQHRTNLVHQNEDPWQVFFNELTRIINRNHPLFMPLELADMDRVSLEQAGAFLSQCINPADYTFIFTGNLNIDILREYSSTYIASIPNATSLNRWNNPGVTLPAEGRRTINKGKDERCIVYLGWFARGPADFNEQRNQVAEVLSEYLEIKLNDEIRERLGGVYSIYADATVMIIPTGEYRINVYFMCNPSRANELITAVQNCITDISRQPINIDTFNKSKEALLMQHTRSMQNNLHIARNYANSSVLYNTPLNRLNLTPSAIRAVTPENMQTLCREMIVSGPVQLLLLPEK